MTYWCEYCGDWCKSERCPECARECEELKSGLKSKKSVANIDKQLSAFESKEEFRIIFGEYFHIRGKK